MPSAPGRLEVEQGVVARQAGQVRRAQPQQVRPKEDIDQLQPIQVAVGVTAGAPNDEDIPGAQRPGLAPGDVESLAARHDHDFGEIVVVGREVFLRIAPFDGNGEPMEPVRAFERAQHRGALAVRAVTFCAGLWRDRQGQPQVSSYDSVPNTPAQQRS